MEAYSVKKLAQMAGITPRTLRHYDHIGLLVPERLGSGDYRVYRTKEVDRLQEILIYRELGMELSEIAALLDDSDQSRESRLKSYLDKLTEKKANIEVLIENVEKTIKAQKGEIEMSDDKKFNGIKKEVIRKNELKYGGEIREKWGDEVVNESKRKMMKMNQEDFENLKTMAAEINTRLENAVNADMKADSNEALEIAKLHRKWLDYTWPDYDPEAHLGLVEMYLADERFKKYYDSKIDGCAKFLRDAVVNMLQ